MLTKVFRLPVAALLLLTGTQAFAQTSITQSVVLNPPSTPFAYTAFSVQTAGTFDLFTVSQGFETDNGTDPISYLFSGMSTNGAGLGALIDVSDDGYFACGSSNIYDPCLQGYFLSAGNYTLATALFGATEQDARDNTYSAGYYDDTGAHSVDVFINSSDGVAVEATPEPASMVLMATGLLAVIGVRNRRKSV